MENSTNLIGIYSELHIKFPTSGYNSKITELEKISDTSFEQLDYLLSLILEEINGEGSDE
ncbi:MAG: hypothetical protein IMZ64_09790 [Bacteroidetes bacterium]|nr:hypothetical protein [Bacteroidota bacterium]